MKLEKSCGAIIYTELVGERKYLLIRHMNGGHWAFPKGHVEAGEIEEETALREISEETGLTVELNTQFRKQVSYQPKPDVTKDVIYFAAKAETEEVLKQEIEVTDFKWLPYQEAIELITYHNDRDLLEEVNNYLSLGRKH